MKRSVLYSSVLSLALLALPFGYMTSATDATIRHTIVAASGAAAPAGGNYALFFNARLNTRHEVAFDAILSGPSISGVFVGDGSTTSTIALGGNPDPAAGNFGFVMKPFITPNGSVVFNVNFNSVFKSNRRGIVPLVQDGDQAAGGGTVTPLVSAANDGATNDGGAIAYRAQVSDSTATQGIFRTDGTGTAAIARDDIGAPTGGSFTSFFEPVINSRGLEVIAIAISVVAFSSVCASPPRVPVTGELAGQRIETTLDSPVAAYYLEHYLRGDPSDGKMSRTIEKVLKEQDPDPFDRRALERLSRRVSTDFATIHFVARLYERPASRRAQDAFGAYLGRLKESQAVDDPGLLADQRTYLFAFVPGYAYKKDTTTGADFARQRTLFTEKDGTTPCGRLARTTGSPCSSTSS